MVCGVGGSSVGSEGGRFAVMYCIHFDTPGPAPATPSSDSTLCADICEVRCWYLLLLLR